jgi:hypothetical protein
MALDIGQMFVDLENVGFFDYVLPFLIVFAIVFAILEKSEWLGTNKAVKAIISTSVGLLATWGMYLTDFYKEIFPKMGIGIAVILVLLIFVGFFVKGSDDGAKKLQWLGWVVGAVVIVWTLNSWNLWGGYGYGGFWYVLENNWWVFVVIGLVIWGIISIVKGDKAATP